jgi:hypothetical protein
LGRQSVEAAIREEFSPHVVERYLGGQPAYDGEQVAYLVVRNGDVRYAGVVLYRRDGDRGFEFGTKVMDETEGPNYYDFPVDWLGMLDEPLGYSAEWRSKVMARSRNRSEAA